MLPSLLVFLAAAAAAAPTFFVFPMALVFSEFLVFPITLASVALLASVGAVLSSRALAIRGSRFPPVLLAGELAGLGTAVVVIAVRLTPVSSVVPNAVSLGLAVVVIGVVSTWSATRMHRRESTVRVT